jgi:hypothetical protein
MQSLMRASIDVQRLICRDQCASLLAVTNGSSPTADGKCCLVFNGHSEHHHISCGSIRKTACALAYTQSQQVAQELT